MVNEDNSKVTLFETGGDVIVNGTEVDKKLELGHGDRIIFGNNHMYVLYHPQVRKSKYTNKYTNKCHFKSFHFGDISSLW